MIEAWRPVVGLEGRYEVSSEGRVRSLAFRSNGPPRIMKSTPNYAGYHVITLGVSRKQYRVAVLVLEAFVGPRPVGMEACHGPDYSKSNNRLRNLRWDTSSANCLERDFHGSRNPNSVLTDEQRAEIIRRKRAGERTLLIAKEFGISQGYVYQLAA